jgi:hypothetical protein
MFRSFRDDVFDAMYFVAGDMTGQGISTATAIRYCYSLLQLLLLLLFYLCFALDIYSHPPPPSFTVY